MSACDVSACVHVLIVLLVLHEGIVSKVSYVLFVHVIINTVCCNYSDGELMKERVLANVQNALHKQTVKVLYTSVHCSSDVLYMYCTSTAKLIC